MKEANILLVEDDEDIRDMVAGYLENEGYRVAEADCGSAALEIVKREHPDLIVLDVLLPDMSGFDLCLEVRKLCVMPIVYMSCMDDSKEIIHGLELGGDDYVTKPFDPKVLITRVKACLRRYRGMGADRDDRAPKIVTVFDLETLTKKEAEILELISRGLSNDQIAQQLKISIGTVKWFNTQIFGKMNVKTRAQAIAKLHELRR